MILLQKYSRYTSIIKTLFFFSCHHDFLLDGECMSPNPKPNYIQIVTQIPNNRRGEIRNIPIFLKGSMSENWEEDDQGYLLLPIMNDRNSTTSSINNAAKQFMDSKEESISSSFHLNNYVYAQEDNNGNIVPTDMYIGQTSKHNLEMIGVKKKQTRDYKQNRSSNTKKSRVQDFLDSDDMVKNVTKTKVNKKNLVVLMRYSDHTSRILPTVDDINILMNYNAKTSSGKIIYHPSAPTGSLRDFYLDTSYGLFTLDSTIGPWVTISRTESQCAGGVNGDNPYKFHPCLVEALEQTNKFINFKDFDLDSDGDIDFITFLHSGYGAEHGGYDTYGKYYKDRIWSHKWELEASGNGFKSKEDIYVNLYHISPALWGLSGSKIGRIGVIAHESGHFLGLPDLYDLQGGIGIGHWGLMGISW